MKGWEIVITDIQFYAGQTEILGNEIEAVIDFIARIATDSGVFEAKQCLINLIENI